mgnify:CR=1 FL=1
MKRSNSFINLILISLVLPAMVAKAQDSVAERDDSAELRSRWVCVANIKRGTVYGYGDTMEEARDSVLRRCFPRSLCLEHMTCRQKNDHL